MLIGLADRLEQLHPPPGSRRRASSRQFPALHRFVLNKWYFDELYDLIFVRPSLWLGRLFWKRGDEGTIDRFGPHGAAYAVGVGNRLTARLQSGYLYSYALVMLLGLIGAATWAIWWAASDRPARCCRILIALPLVAAHHLPVRQRQRGALDRAARDARSTSRSASTLWAAYDPGGAAVAVRRAASRSAAASPGRSASTASR